MAWKRKTVPATTNNITKAIINFLLANGHSASRINVQGQWDEKIQAWRKSGSRKGVLDIAAVLLPNGRALFIDVKKDDDELSIDQIEFIREVRAAGGLCFEVKTYQDFLTQYNNLNL